MSHFAVAVFSDGTKTVEQLLAPYQENNMDDCPKEYLQFFSTSAKHRSEWENESTEKVKLKDGRLVWPWSDEANGGEVVTVTYKKLYPTFKEFLEDYICSTFDEEMQDYGYWENPNARWDWYRIGGRWKGMLKAKKGDKGEPSFVCPIKDKDGRFSSAKIKDIDFSPDTEKYNNALRWWEVVMEDSPLKPGERKSDFFNYYKKEYLLKKYKDKETYAKIQSSFSTFAVILPDGTWCEKGKMGWFGCSSDSAEESFDWDMKYKECFIDKADPEWTLTIVDCHI